MRKAVDRHEAEESRRSFEGMKGPKNGTQHFGVVRTLLKNKDALLDIFKMLAGLINKLPQDVAVVLQIHRGVLIKLIGNRRHLRSHLSAN